MDNRILLDNKNEIDDIIIAMQRWPRMFHKGVNYFKLYDKHKLITQFHLSKATFGTVLILIKDKISP